MRLGDEYVTISGYAGSYMCPVVFDAAGNVLSGNAGYMNGAAFDSSKHAVTDAAHTVLYTYSQGDFKLFR